MDSKTIATGAWQQYGLNYLQTDSLIENNTAQDLLDEAFALDDDFSVADAIKQRQEKARKLALVYTEALGMNPYEGAGKTWFHSHRDYSVE